MGGVAHSRTSLDAPRADRRPSSALGRSQRQQTVTGKCLTVPNFRFPGARASKQYHVFWPPKTPHPKCRRPPHLGTPPSTPHFTDARALFSPRALPVPRWLLRARLPARPRSYLVRDGSGRTSVKVC